MDGEVRLLACSVRAGSQSNTWKAAESVDQSPATDIVSGERVHLHHS